MKKILGVLVVATTLTGCSFNFTTNQENSSEQMSEEVVSVDTNGFTAINNSELEVELSKSSKSTLTDLEIEGLLYMREEEKLAYDLYSVLFALWGEGPFKNISISEQTHMEAVLTLLNKYELEDPASGLEQGEFKDSDLQYLYATLLEQGSKSFEEALKVGAIVEEVDIMDIERYLSDVDSPDIRAVYENLLKGSRNHLRAYVKNLEKQGVVYIPQYLSREKYDAVITANMEQGGGLR